MQEVQLDRVRALEHYEMMQDKALARENQKVKRKEILQGDLVLRYNSKLDKTFQKKFQIKWEGPFKVMESFANGKNQLADLDGTLHASRVNGFLLKQYHARLMMVQKDEELVDDMQIKQDDATVDAGSFASLFLAADHE